MNWILNNPADAFRLLWDIAFKPCVMIITVICILWQMAAMISPEHKKQFRRTGIVAIIVSIFSVGMIRVWQFASPVLNTDPGHENYSAYFNDMQKRQISAAQMFGIEPIKDRSVAEKAIQSGNLVKITSCRSYQLAPMAHSIPYLTNDISYRNYIPTGFDMKTDRGELTRVLAEVIADTTAI